VYWKAKLRGRSGIIGKPRPWNADVAATDLEDRLIYDHAIVDHLPTSSDVTGNEKILFILDTGCSLVVKRSTKHL